MARRPKLDAPAPMEGRLARVLSIEAPRARGDDGDVLAMFARVPGGDAVDTGTPLDAAVPRWIIRRSLVALLGREACAKTSLALAVAAHRLRASDSVMVHVSDRDPIAAVHRLARLLGIGAEVLAQMHPGLRLRSGDLARAVDLLVAMPAPHVLIVDSIQTAREHVVARSDAGPSERIDAVFSQLRRATAAGALVLATSEQAPSGEARHTEALRHAADVRVRCERDGQGRFSVVAIKPPGLESARRWFALADDGRPLDVTAPLHGAAPSARIVEPGERPARQTVGRRRGRNAPARTDAEIARDVLEFVREHSECTGEGVERGVTGRRQRVRDALANLAATGRILRGSKGWCAE